MSNIINNHLGYLFPIPAVASGYIFMPCGIFAIDLNPIVGIGLVFMGCFISLTKTGIQINLAEQQYKEYVSYFGIKLGKWKSLSVYSDISILTKRRLSSSSKSIAKVSSNSTEVHYDVCLLDKNHRRKLIVHRLKSKAHALDEARSLAVLINVQLSKYNPTISSITKQRKMR